MIFKDSDIGLLRFTVNFSQDNTPVVYSMYLGIKDVSTSNHLRYKDVPERLCTEGDRFLFYDYQVITLSTNPFFI